MPRKPESVKAPTGRQARQSAIQNEILEALEMLKSGEGSSVNGFLVLELEHAKNVGAARSAVSNVRWKFNPDNKESKAQDQSGVFDRLFKSAGRGAIQVYAGEQDAVLIAVPESYAKATASAPATTERSAEESTKGKK